MPTEFQTLIMRAKAVHRNPIDGTTTLELEPSEQTPEMKQLLHRLVFGPGSSSVQVVVDSEVKQ